MIEEEFEGQDKADSATADWKTNYRPEAGVINFYQVNEDDLETLG